MMVGDTAERDGGRCTVFISHATDDRAWAEAVCHAIEEAGIRCWMAPRDIEAGSDWASAIVRAIEGCGLLVVVLSEYTGSSPATVSEVREAFTRGRPILAVSVDSAPVGENLSLFLGGANRLDATRSPRGERLREVVAAVSAAAQEVEGTERRRRGATPGHLGPYRLVRLLGEGGFGEVWLAERREDYTKRLAVKVIKPGMDTRAVIARFEQERQVLAVMDHPNVAKVFDAGETSQGRPYFVMEYVDGRPITDYCDEQRLTVRERLELFILVCEAVQHAHTKAIIHRDLKPSNILVASVDGKATPKVIDFGVAKAIGQMMTAKTLFTEQGALIGTPEYMSPEQASLGAVDVDTRTDVYALGALLYELLVGSPPFDTAALRGLGYDEIRRTIREVDPPRPSTRLVRTASGRVGPQSADGEGAPPGLARDLGAMRRTDIRTLSRHLRRELEWIPLKALEKDRNRRYGTPRELADDIRAYLEGLPLAAAPPSAVYRLRKLARRHRGVIISVAAVIVALAIGMSLALWNASVARANEAIAMREARIGAMDNLLLQEVLRAGSSPAALKEVQMAADSLVALDRDARARVRPIIEARLTVVSLVEIPGEPLIEVLQDAPENLQPDPLTSLFAMAIYCRMNKRPDEACRYYTEWEDILEQLVGEEYWFRGAAKGGHASALIDLGRFEDAEAHLHEASRILRESLGDEHFLTRRIESGYVRLYEQWGKPELVQQWRDYSNRIGARIRDRYR